MAKVLCVEDDADLRAVLAEELRDAGYDVVEAVDGKDGLNAILTHTPDMVLCDITMPVMDGHELLRELRARHSKFADTPFVFLSANADKQDILTGLEIGADDYLTKPVDFDLLRLKVRASLRQISRMTEKTQRQHVKLYKALAPGGERQQETEEATPSNLVQLISLDEIKDALGERWAALMKNAMLIAEGVIKRNLAVQDIHKRRGDDSFLLFFQGLSQQEARFKAETIAGEIQTNLLGKDADLQRAITVGGKTVKVKSVDAAGGPLSIETVVSAPKGVI